MHDETWLFTFLTSFINNATAQNFFAVILLWIQTILINNTCIEHKLSRENTLFPGLFYALMISFTPAGLSLHSLLLANTFLILGLINVIHSSKHVDLRHFLFNAGFFLTLAMFIYPAYLFFIGIGLFGFYTLKTLKPIGNLQFFTGIITGLILVSGTQYLIEGSWMTGVNFSPFWQVAPQAMPDLTSWIFITIYAFILFSTIGFYPDLISKKNIQSRKKIELIYVVQLSTLLSAVFFFQGNLLEIMVLGFPLGTLIGLRLSELKSPVFAEVIHLILLSGLFINHYLSV